jgi:single-stranded DNA-binding protein
MRIAVNGVGDEEAMFLDITAFGKEAEACSQHLHKGRRIGFDGRLQHCAWVDDDGSKRSKFSGAGHVEFLDNAPRADAAGAPETTPVVASAEGDRAGGGTAGELVSRESRARPGHRGVARLHVESRDFERPVDCSPQWSRRFASRSVTAAARHDSARDSF